MKKIFVYIFLCLISIIYSATEPNNVAKNKKTFNIDNTFAKKFFENYYLQSLSDKNKANIIYTPLYLQGLEYYTNPAKFQKKKSHGKKYNTPRIEKIKELFLKSYFQEKNEMALTSLVYLYKQFGSNSDLLIQAEYIKIVSELASNGNCLGMLEKARYFKYGKGDIPQNKKEAYKLLKNAAKKCVNSYTYSGIYSELYSLEKRKKQSNKQKHQQKT